MTYIVCGVWWRIETLTGKVLPVDFPYLTIYDALAERLGRKPTHEETKAEVRRIIADALPMLPMRGSTRCSPHIQSIGRAVRVQS